MTFLVGLAGGLRWSNLTIGGLKTPGETGSVEQISPNLRKTGHDLNSCAFVEN